MLSEQPRLVSPMWSEILSAVDSCACPHRWPLRNYVRTPAARIRPDLADCCQMGRYSPNLPRKRPTLAELAEAWRVLARVWPICAKDWSKSF